MSRSSSRRRSAAPQTAARPTARPSSPDIAGAAPAGTVDIDDGTPTLDAVEGLEGLGGAGSAWAADEGHLPASLLTSVEVDDPSIDLRFDDNTDAIARADRLEGYATIAQGVTGGVELAATIAGNIAVAAAASLVGVIGMLCGTWFALSRNRHRNLMHARLAGFRIAASNLRALTQQTEIPEQLETALWGAGTGHSVWREVRPHLLSLNDDVAAAEARSQVASLARAIQTEVDAAVRRFRAEASEQGISASVIDGRIPGLRLRILSLASTHIDEQVAIARRESTSW